MNPMTPNGQAPVYFDPNQFFKDKLSAEEKVIKFLIPLLAEKTEEALGGLDKSLYSENYIQNIVDRYLGKLNENPPFNYLDVHIFDKRKELIDNRNDDEGLMPSRRAAAKPPLARHNSAMDDEISFDYVMKHGHIKGIFVI